MSKTKTMYNQKNEKKNYLLYNQNGTVRDNVKFDSSGKIQSKESFEYNSSGQIKKHKNYNSSNQIISQKKYKNASLISSTFYRYDENAKLITSCTEYATTREKQILHYDLEGNIKHYEIFDNLGIPSLL